MRSMQWQLGMLGTISAFAFTYRETKKNLCRDGRSQEQELWSNNARYLEHKQHTSNPQDMHVSRGHSYQSNSVKALSSA